MLKIVTIIFALTGLMQGLYGNVVFNIDPVKTTKIVINPAKSSLRWDGYKVTGQHHGSVDIESGELLFADGQLKSGQFTIDMRSIEVHDLEGSSKAKLENHLKSDDFFGVEMNPKALFQIDRAIPYGNHGLYKIEGKLTIKNITKPIKFEAQLDERDGLTIANSKIQVDRSEYNVRYGSGSFFDNLGDKTIYDEFDIQVKLVGSLPEAN